MRVEASLVGKKVILVPYVESHVPKYHEWIPRSPSPSTRSSPFSGPGPSTPSSRLLLCWTRGWLRGSSSMAILTLKLSRGKGLGKESVLMMTAFAVQNFGIQSFRAKIGDSNDASLSMFRNMGFKDSSYSEVFREVTLELVVTESQHKELQQILSDHFKNSHHLLFKAPPEEFPRELGREISLCFIR